MKSFLKFQFCTSFWPSVLAFVIQTTYKFPLAETILTGPQDFRTRLKLGQFKVMNIYEYCKLINACNKNNKAQ